MHADAPPPAARSPLLPALAGLVTLFHLLTSQDGHFRDELYYLACGEHLGFGYVDHPPLIGLVAAAVDATLGHSLLALRLLPALAAGVTVWLTGAIAAELGGARFAQLLAGLCAAVAPVLVSLFSYLSMNAFDLALWATAWWLYVRLLHRPSTRRWLLLGLVLGVALENKISVLGLGLGILVGLLVARRWELLRTRGPWLAAGVAVLLFVPHILWQVVNGWPTLEFMHNARVHKMQAVAPGDWLLEQWQLMNPLAAPVWLAGLAYLLGAPAARAFRAVGVAALTVLLVLLIGQGKGYYSAPVYLPLFAAGGVAIERLLAGRRLAGLARAALVVLVLGGGLVGLPLAKPVLSVEHFVRYQAALGLAPSAGGERHEMGQLPAFFADRHGWAALAAQVAAVHASLPPAERQVACIFAENYGQAGAIDLFGRAHGLPRALAGHNSYWLWGPGRCSGEVILVIGGARTRLEQVFERVEQAATFRCELCMPYENDKPIFVGRGSRVPLAALWPHVKHYD